MGATIFPIACSMEDVRENFLGLGDVLGSLAEYVGKDEEELFSEQARVAQDLIEDRSRLPFFVTRFCTRELGKQLNLTLGTDYDRMVQAQDYDAYDWLAHTGRLDLDHGYLAGVDRLRFSTVGNGQLWDMPADWLNADEEAGILHVMPNPGGSDLIITRITGFFPYLRSYQDYVPKLIHLQYRAGLVLPPSYSDFTSYEPTTAMEATEWDPNLVRSYQKMLGKHAAGDLMLKLANEWDGAGSQIAFDGLSQSVSPQVLEKRAAALKEEAVDWSAKLLGRKRGLPMVFA